MKKILIVVFLIIFSIILGNIYAQQINPPQRQRIFSEEFRDLQRILRDLQELEKDKKLALTKDQAKKLVEVLQDLIKRNTLPPKEAEKFVERIEKILTDAQITYLDKLEIERQKRLEELRKQWQQQAQTGQFPQRPQSSSQQQRQVDTQMQKVITEWQKGNYLNPYYYVPSFKKSITDLIEKLKKK